MQLFTIIFSLIVLQWNASSFVHASAIDGDHTNAIDNDSSLTTQIEERMRNLESMLLSATQQQKHMAEELQEKLVKKDIQIQQLHERVGNYENKLSTLSRLAERQQTLINDHQRSISWCKQKTSEQDSWVREYLASSNHSQAESRDVTDGASGTVAFSAYITHNLYNLGPNSIIPFQGIVLNEGNAYNSNVGVFTAPRDGVYFFSFALEDMETHRLWVRLVVNGDLQSSAIVRPSIPGIMAFNLAIVRLTSGQSVWLAIDPQADNNSIQGTPTIRTSTFSGVFLHP